MEPPLCGTWVIRSTVYVGAPPSGKYWIFSQGYMGPKCAACGAGEWSLDGMAPCRKCDDCSTRGGVLSQGPGRVLQSDSSHPRASPNCTATADTGCVLPRSCQLGLTFSTSGREPCTYVWGIHVGNRVESVRTGARVFVYSCIRVFVYSCIRVFVYSCIRGVQALVGLCARKIGRVAKEGDMYCAGLYCPVYVPTALTTICRPLILYWPYTPRRLLNSRTLHRACKGCFEGVQYHLQDSCTLTANTVCDTTVNVDPGVLTLNGGDNRPSSAASPQAPAVRQIAVVSLLAVFVVGGRSSVWRR